MFEKKDDKKKAKEEAQKRQAEVEADKQKTKEEKALEAKEARDDGESLADQQKNQIEKSFGDDQNHRYDPKDLEKAQANDSEKSQGVIPGQAIHVDRAQETHINVPRKKDENVDKDYSKEIKIGDLVYLKPKQGQPENIKPSPIDGRPWSVLDIKEDKASCMIMDPSDNLQKHEVYPLKDLMLDPPK